MSDLILENPSPDESDPSPIDSTDSDARLVPVAEAIKYRRRAQQAEQRLQELEQRFQDLQSQIQQHGEQLALAEAQRDEAQHQLIVLENRLLAERNLAEAGVVDPETAGLLLAERMDFSEPLEVETLREQIEQLLLEKPFLQRAFTGLPTQTASARNSRAGMAARLTQAAQSAAISGNRQDVAHYLRLRRQAARV